jgi:tellurite resistance protein
MTLGLLVGRFGEFLYQQHDEMPEPEQAPPSADDLERIRECCGHHLVMLTLLSRADGESAPSERDVIFDYCVARCRKKGLEAMESEAAALRNLLVDYKPARFQLDLAIRRLSHEPKEDIAALLDAAVAVVDADGVRRPSELQFLQELRLDLDAL